MREVEVAICPYCGDTWEVTNKELLHKECRCFRCWNTYILEETYNMWDFVLHAIRTVKGK